jgi:Zn-dependent protease with chaperone function
MLLAAVVLAAVSGINSPGQEPAPQHLTGLRVSLPRNDRQELLYVLQFDSPTILHRYPGDKVFLDEVYGPDPDKAEFLKKLASIARRLDIDMPDVLIAYPVVDDKGNPKPQKPDASIGWANNVHGKHHDIVFVTKNVKDGLTDEQLLATIAHEMGHFPQFKKDGSKETQHGRKLEAAADAFALSCPEVDPNDFKSMLIEVEKLQDQTAREHPLLYKDFIGSTKVIPASVQTNMAFGGDHPMTRTRIKEAEKEIQRRAASAAPAGPLLNRP